MSDLFLLSVNELSENISSRKISPVDLYNTFTQRIEKFNSKLNCFIEVFDDWKNKAEIAEKEIFDGKIRGPLHGIPIAVKDLINVKGKVTTAGSKILINNQANESAVIISALETAGAIIIGKTSLVEFALGPHGINSSLPQTKNPWDLTRIPGGSSSGSACSVASSLCPIAIGSDTGGSIRMPASFCGVTGFKPSFNKLNTSGVFPLSWSLDTIGPIAKTAKDCSIFVEEICKHQIANKNKDPFNGLTTSMLDNFVNLLSPNLKIGVPSDDFFSDVEEEVKKEFFKSIELMKSMGAEIIEVDLAWLLMARPVNVVITLAEAFSLHKHWLESDSKKYTFEVISRLVLGENISLNDYFSSMRAMNYIQKRISEVFKRFDVLACPTIPELPSLISDYSKENLLKSKNIVGGKIPLFTSLFNVTRQPSISTTAGFSSKGLPIGVMFTGKFNEDYKVLQVGNWFEKITNIQINKIPNI